MADKKRRLKDNTIKENLKLLAGVGILTCGIIYAITSGCAKKAATSIKKRVDDYKWHKSEQKPEQMNKQI